MKIEEMGVLEMEALLNRAELLLWKCRKELCFGKLDELKKKCNKEQDDVLRMEGNLFAKMRRDHEERLAEEKQEATQARLELELLEKELVELECQISALESISSIYSTDNMNDIFNSLGNMFFINKLDFINQETIFYLKDYFVIILISIISCTPLFKNIYLKYKDNKVISFIEPIILLGLFILCVSFIIDASFNPFLYFRF